MENISGERKGMLIQNANVTDMKKHANILSLWS